MDLASSLNSCLFMLRPYLRISAIPPCLPVILDARLPLPYLRGRVCASEGILFSLFGLELVPGVLMQTQSAGGLVGRGPARSKCKTINVIAFHSHALSARPFPPRAPACMAHYGLAPRSYFLFN